MTRDEMLRSAWWYKLRFVSLILCVVAAVTFGCSKDDAIQPSDPITSVTPPTGAEPNQPDTPTEDTTPPTTPVQKHNVELEFDAFHTDNLHMDTIQKYARDDAVDTIFMVSNKGSIFSSLEQQYITAWRNYLEQRTNVSPRVRGRGDFWFEYGAALPADSLWFVSKGWTVNKR